MDDDESTLELIELAGGMPSIVLGAVPERVIDLLPRPRVARERAGTTVLIPEPCQQLVAGLESYGG